MQYFPFGFKLCVCHVSIMQIFFENIIASYWDIGTKTKQKLLHGFDNWKEKTEIGKQIRKKIKIESWDHYHKQKSGEAIVRIEYRGCQNQSDLRVLRRTGLNSFSYCFLIFSLLLFPSIYLSIRWIHQLLFKAHFTTWLFPFLFLF